jgi:hypothetical protein
MQETKREAERNKICGYWICDVYCIVSKVNKAVAELKYHAMKTFGENEPLIHEFLTSPRDSG